MTRHLSFTLLFLFTIYFFGLMPVNADSPLQEQVDPFVYSVQPGDTLIFIALKYNLNLADIALANHLQNPGLVVPGQRLILPGVATLSNQELSTVIGEQTHTVQPGETIFTIASIYFTAPDDVIALNDLPDPDLLQVGQLLTVPVIQPPPSPPLTWPFSDVSLSEPTIIQGRTLIVRVSLADEATLTGDFEGQPFSFYHDSGNDYWAIVAIHALIEPNIYQIHLTATLPDGQTLRHPENLNIVEGPYSSEAIVVDDTRAGLLAPEVIQQEREKLETQWLQVTPRPLWEGTFGYPVDENPPRVTSDFGTRRTYNNSTAMSFHGGSDFGGGVGVPIYAPAGGVVALAETLHVRGNAVLIDHGMGLFSGYWHQSKIVVTAGQRVQPGDLIGYVGDTGLVTGPHLHWEFRLNGIAVEPLQWVSETIP
ncbi:MAG: LysM peptidoglycan-binding domain-containing M23 family metallopeptidase [Anaerolineae bacterium]|nr:LysM peptidoglycan-binding domain-containing M23 family metallopeptidase [Anaerolineae bacterium]